jgi:hypothetical protein
MQYAPLRNLMKRDKRTVPTAIHGPSGLKILPLGNANATADCLENLFTSRGLGEKSQERSAEVRVQVLSELMDDVSPCNVLKVKVKLSLCLNKHHAMKTYWRVEV